MPFTCPTPTSKPKPYGLPLSGIRAAGVGGEGALSRCSRSCRSWGGDMSSPALIPLQIRSHQQYSRLLRTARSVGDLLRRSTLRARCRALLPECCAWGKNPQYWELVRLGPNSSFCFSRDSGPDRHGLKVFMSLQILIYAEKNAWLGTSG